MIGVAAGWLADLRFGDPARGHPVAGFGRLAAALERAMWRPERGAGALYTAALVGGAAAAAGLVDRALRRHPLARQAFLAAVLWASLGGRSLAEAGEHLADLVSAGDLAAARAFLPTLAGRTPSALGLDELCRAGLESVAENAADAVVGPLFWAVVAGPAGVAAYRAANTLDAMVGHRTPRYEQFGWASARLDDVLSGPAARLAAGLAVLAAPAVGGDPACARATLARDGHRHPSPNAGRAEAAFAGALGVRLGGTNVYAGHTEDRPHLGDGPAPGPDDLRRAVRLSRVVGWSAAALCALAG